MGILPVGNPDQGIKWLSIDNIYEEYAIYTQCPYGSEFDEMNIFRDGYHQADAGQAVVTSCFGQVDTSMGDTVRYTEYEDGTEEPSLRWSNGRMKQSIPKAVIWIWMKSYSLTAVVPDRWEQQDPFGFVNMKNLAVAAVILAVLERYPIRTYSQIRRPYINIWKVLLISPIRRQLHLI